MVPINRPIQLGPKVLNPRQVAGLGAEPGGWEKFAAWARQDIATPFWGALGSGLAVGLRSKELRPVNIAAWSLLGGAIGYASSAMWGKPHNAGIVTFLTSWLLHQRQGGPERGFGIGFPKSEAPAPERPS